MTHADLRVLTSRHDIEDPSQENGDIYLHPESWLDVGLIKIK